uniref:Uncharacterized protein n=1 Tax=Zea mays TaxID=4577 RepID=A0A804QSS0_MAIZE
MSTLIYRVRNSSPQQILLVMVDSLAKLSMDVGDKDLVYSLLLVFSGMLMDEKGKDGGPICARESFDFHAFVLWGCDGENPYGVQKGFEAMMFHPEQAGSRYGMVLSAPVAALGLRC